LSKQYTVEDGFVIHYTLEELCSWKMIKFKENITLCCELMLMFSRMGCFILCLCCVGYL